MRKFKDSIAYGWRETCKEFGYFDVLAVCVCALIVVGAL